MWEDGIFLGVKGSTGDMIVGDEKGVWRTRTIRRKPEGERWSRDFLEKIGGVPWGMTKERPGDGEEMKTEVTIMDKEYRERTRVEEHEAVPRKVYISKDDFGSARVHSGMRRMQVGVEGDDETGAHRKLQEEDGKGVGWDGEGDESKEESG